MMLAKQLIESGVESKLLTSRRCLVMMPPSLSCHFLSLASPIADFSNTTIPSRRFVLSMRRPSAMLHMYENAFICGDKVAQPTPVRSHAVVTPCPSPHHRKYLRPHPHFHLHSPLQYFLFSRRRKKEIMKQMLVFGLSGAESAHRTQRSTQPILSETDCTWSAARRIHSSASERQNLAGSKSTLYCCAMDEHQQHRYQLMKLNRLF